MVVTTGAALAKASSASDYLRLAPVTTATKVLAVNGKVMIWHPVVGVLPPGRCAA